MIKSIFLSIGILSALNVSAQQTTIEPIPAEKKNEIGIFSNSVISSRSNNSLIMAGVQYKHWVKPNTAYRTLVSYARYTMNDMRPSTKAPNNDTVYSIWNNTNVNMTFVGAGIEMQRHFYKKVYLYAALELRGGTGRGVSEDMEAAQYMEPGKPYFSTNNFSQLTTKNVSMSYIGFVPSIGGKFQFKRISFGAELSPLEISYKSTNIGGIHSGVADMNLGDFSNRFFINFRF